MGTTKQQTLGERSQEKAEVRRLVNPLSCAVLPDPVSERPTLEYSRKTVKPDKPRGTTTQDVRLVLLLVLLLLLLCIFFVLMLPFFNLSPLLMCSYWCHYYVLPNDDMSGSWINTGEAGPVISFESMGIILNMGTKIWFRQNVKLLCLNSLKKTSLETPPANFKSWHFMKHYECD